MDDKLKKFLCWEADHDVSPGYETEIEAEYAEEAAEKYAEADVDRHAGETTTKWLNGAEVLVKGPSGKVHAVFVQGEATISFYGYTVPK